MTRPYSVNTSLSTLTARDMQGARLLPLATTGGAGSIDRIGFFTSNERNAILTDDFKFDALEGATYNILSASFEDPIIPILYDSQGRVIAYDDDVIDGVGEIEDFVAPYTGTFYVSASWNQGDLSDQWRVSLTVTEDDDTITPLLPVRINSTSADRFEGNTGETLATFTIARTDGGFGPMVLAWAAEGSEVDKTDFSGGKWPTGSIIFAAGETSKTVVVRVAGDTRVEPHEFYALTLRDPLRAELGVVYMTGQIRDDDRPPSITVLGKGQSADFLFDAPYYLAANPLATSGVTIASAPAHYRSIGAASGLSPAPWFDATWYEARWPDLARIGLDDATLFAHFNLFGVWEGRAPSARFQAFDGPRYLTENPDVAAFVNANLPAFLGSATNGAIAHLLLYGTDELRPAYTTTGTMILSDFWG